MFAGLAAGRPFKRFWLNKRVLIGSVIVIFAIVGTVSTFLSRAAQLVNSETIALSNGKEIRLGQSLAVALKAMPEGVRKINERQYSYPGLPGRQPEVIIEVDNDQIVVMHVVQGQGKLKSIDNSSPRMSLRELALRQRTTAGVRGRLAELRPGSLMIDQNTSTQYFFNDPCSQAGQTEMISLVRKGYEARVVRALAQPGCVDVD